MENPIKLRGDRPDTSFMELLELQEQREIAEAVKFYKDFWPSLNQAPVGTGIIMVFGTGGEVRGEDYMNMFVNPEAFNLIPINKWEDKGTNCGFFTPINKE